MIKLYSDWHYLLHRIAILYGKEVCFELKTKHLTIQPQETIVFNANNQVVFLHSSDSWLQVKSKAGEFNPSNPELNQNIVEHYGQVSIKNLQSNVSGIVGNIVLIETSIK